LQDPDLERDFPKRWPASVSIATQAGKVFETHVDYPKGDPENPLTWEELIQKFNDLTAPVFEVSARHRIVDLVRNLEAEGDLKRLTKLLARNDKE
jgi:2-methylcitrate dehydratase PrpD